MEDARLDRLARAHNALAPGYDAALAQNPVAVWMRARLWAHYARVIPRNARVLDFTAGTGADALYLAERGAAVVALDVSPGMLQELERRATARHLHVETRVLAAETLDRLDAGTFDAAISGFAGLNTIQNLPQLAAALANRLNPHGRVIVHALNSFCAWERVNQLIHHQARARSPQTPIGGEIVAPRFYQPAVLYREVFAPHFGLVRVYALSVLAAPTWVKRLGAAAPLILRFDQAVGRAFPAAGDFFVMDLEKRGDGGPV
jgi:2-polyprenyl-3-methyl-5-hydroxy-6-metoxy-1,4-benzoquinol methylase